MLAAPHSVKLQGRGDADSMWPNTSDQTCYVVALVSIYLHQLAHQTQASLLAFVASAVMARHGPLAAAQYCLLAPSQMFQYQNGTSPCPQHRAKEADTGRLTP